MHACECLTNPFHGLVQNLGILSGIEVLTGFNGSSGGLQHGRNAQRRIILRSSVTNDFFFKQLIATDTCADLSTNKVYV